MIDLRSDTTSKPTAEMRRVMAEAEVGDDVLGDDPTVRALEARVAEVLGKQAAVFVPSGTMANQLALRAHTTPGDWIVAEAGAHVLRIEGAATGGLAGVATTTIAGTGGIFTADDLAATMPPDHRYLPDMSGYVPKLVCLENTHNGAGGTVWPLNELVAVCGAAEAAGMARHLDGARLWNAAAATGVSEAAYTAPFDTVSVCFSKGLGAPIGSALVGSEDLIARARRFRSAYGGAMRQAGIVAAGAHYALEHHRPLLQTDHANARRLGEALAGMAGIDIDLDSVQTNIARFFVTAMPAGEFVDRLAGEGVMMLPFGPALVRAVTCLDVTADDIEQAIAAIRRVLPEK